MATVELTAANFTDVVTANEIVVVDFWAAWCGPCRRFAPVFEDASEQHPQIVFGKVDTEAEAALAAAFEIRSIPTLVVFREQVLVFAQPGALPGAALASLLEQVEALDMVAVHAELASSQVAGAAQEH